MVVLPKPVVSRAISRDLPVSLAPTDIGYFPKAQWHYFDRPDGAPQLIAILCVHGKGWLRFNRREYSVAPGQMVVIRPNQPHAYGADPAQPWSIYWCHAAGQVAEKFGKRLLEEYASPVLEPGDHPRLIALFTEMLGELEQGCDLDHLLPASAALSHLLGLVWKSSRVQSDARSDAALRVRRVAEHLGRFPERAISVAELAEMANLSISHFCALFKRLTNFAPIDYVLHMRIQRACELLDTSGQPVKRIAGETGFSDPLYFSRVFRRVHGISPKAYRAISKG